MSSEWNRGVLTKSSWHGLEDIGVMADAAAMIAHGEKSGAWPVQLESVRLYTSAEHGSILAPLNGIKASYANHPAQVLGVNSSRYRATSPDEWRGVVQAACAAGAQPTGAFSLRDGSRILATFDINGYAGRTGRAAGIHTKLLLADSFDGSLRLTCGTTSIDVVCANTLAVSLKEDGGGMAKIRHSASLEERVNVLTANIGLAVKGGQKVRDLMQSAENTVLSRQAAIAAFDLLFPPAPQDADKQLVTRAENARNAAKAAAVLPINRVGNRGNLATLWNAATYLVDRREDGSFRETRSGDALDSMLFGTRAQRVQEIQTIIEVIMRDGTVQQMTAPEALEAGCDRKIIGSKLLEEMVNDYRPPTN